MTKAYKLGIAAALLAVLVVSIVDVVGRYVFNAPLIGADDLIRFGMALIVFGALPAVSRAGEHITVDLVAERLPARAQRAIARLWNGCAALALAYIAWRLFDLGLRAVDYGDRSPMLRLPFPPLIFFMSACATVAAGIELVRMCGPKPVRGPGTAPAIPTAPQR